MTPCRLHRHQCQVRGAQNAQNNQWNGEGPERSPASSCLSTLQHHPIPANTLFDPQERVSTPLADGSKIADLNPCRITECVYFSPPPPRPGLCLSWPSAVITAGLPPRGRTRNSPAAVGSWRSGPIQSMKGFLLVSSDEAPSSHSRDSDIAWIGLVGPPVGRQQPPQMTVPNPGGALQCKKLLIYDMNAVSRNITVVSWPRPCLGWIWDSVNRTNTPSSPEVRGDAMLVEAAGLGIKRGSLKAIRASTEELESRG